MKSENLFIKMIQNTGFILTLAFVFGLTLPKAATFIKDAVTPILAIIITLSITSVSIRRILDLKQFWKPTLIALLLNYVILTFTILGLSYFLLQDKELITGFIVLAAIPPAVSVIPFTARLNGDLNYSLTGTIALYLFALLFVPIITVYFLGANVIEIERLLITLAELILIPFGIAAILRRTGLSHNIEKYRGRITNWGFFTVVYAIIGANQSAFLAETSIVPRIVLISFICTFVLGFLINKVTKLIHINKERRISLILLGTRKNYGMAAAIIIALFSSKAAIPIVISTAFAIMHFIFLSFWIKRTD
jgi:BASS family bile acid:Na+ symporter